jgi:hypothetical protein
MYKGMLEGEEKGTKNNEILSQKRFDNYELSNLSSNLPNSHASIASVASQRGAGGGAGGGGGTSRHDKDKDKNKKTHVMQKILRDDSPEKEEEHGREREQETRNTIISSNDSTLDASSPEVKNIDDVFIRITDIYTQEVYNIIYNTLLIMIKNDGSFDIYIDGLNKILEPTNSKIKKWIDEHIVF